MQDFVILGVDVSKNTLDVFFKPVGTSLRVENKLSGFKRMLGHLYKHCSADHHVFVVLEHTGLYSRLFESFLRSHNISFCKIPALEIKRSLGVIRGKADKIDARRIAEYGWLRRSMLHADPEVDKAIVDLKSLLGLRSKLVRDRAGYVTRLKEMKAVGYCSADFECRVQEQIINMLAKKIKVVEEKIKELITQHSDLSSTCKLLRTIKGVGWIVACYMISSTANFKKFGSARKFNCYAGLAPFKYESGTSIKGRSRVSHLANKEVKCVLNLAASNAIQYDPEMKTYYQRRVLEGKPKMSCLNIVRSKIVARMFAVIKRQTPYQQLPYAA